MSRFLERLASGPPIVGDGGMGALVSSAVGRLRCPEEANLRAPESVLSIHLGFIRAGADLIETNTFGANRRKLADHYLEDDVAAINEAAVKIARDAREVSGRDVFVAGSIGPLGGPAKDREAIFAEQAQLLEGRGVDLFMVETFYELDELLTAVGAVRSVSSLPVVALLTFDEDAQTLGGVSAEQAATELEPARRGCDRREPRRRAPGRTSRDREDGPRRQAARGAPERRPREPRRRARRLPARDARVLRRVRGTRPRARRSHHRRLLRHDADRDRGDPPRGRRGPQPERAARRPRARDRTSRRRSPSGRRSSSGSSARASSSSPWRSTRRAAGTPRRCSSSRRR